VFGIEGYEPQWHHSGRALAAAHRARFRKLIGQPLHDAWLMWDLDEDRWFADGPVILGFPECNVEITHRKFDECAITWDQVDMTIPLHWSGLRLDWRANAHPILAGVVGRKLGAVNIIERLMAARWRPTVLYAVELVFEDGEPAGREPAGQPEAWEMAHIGPLAPPGPAGLTGAGDPSGAALAAVPTGRRLTIFNALDENGLTDAAEVDLPVGQWQRVPVA